MKWVLLILCLLLINLPLVSAEDIIIIVAKKQQAKKRTRWTLADWFATKKKMALMDQWLALNSSANIFEFYLGADTNQYSFNSQTNNIGSNIDRRSNRIAFSAYVTILGVKYEYDRSNEKYIAQSADLNLRLLGNAAQATNLTISYGVRKLRSTAKFQNQYWGAHLTFYLLSVFGFESQYRNYLLNNGLNGRLKEVGAFIDISFLRLYGTWFKETLNIREENAFTAENREGTRWGIKIYF